MTSTQFSFQITTETITTSTTPVVIRQRVRGRIGTRLHHEPSVQTRNRGSQDEYVRFNAVNQDSTRTTSNRQRVRSRPRTQNHGSQVQTDGNEYIKIHAVQQQRQATTTPAPSTTTTTVRPTEEDIDYGFIRPPNFRPVHPVDNRFQTAVTYRPQLPEVSEDIKSCSFLFVQICVEELCEVSFNEQFKQETQWHLKQQIYFLTQFFNIQ